jgi:chaperonin GroEL
VTTAEFSTMLQGLAAREALARGMERMTALLRPTLGPTGRTVAIAPILTQRPPEVLDSGATIARRTIQLADPFEDMGAMLIREMVVRLADEVGDGTATAAVLAQAIMRDALPALAAGYNPIPLKRGIEVGAEAALAALEAQARPIDTPAEIAAVVAAVLGPGALAQTLGEILEAVGPDGAVVVEDGQASDVSHEYVDGIRWSAELASSHFLPSGEGAVRLLWPRILVSISPLERPEQLVPALEACVAAGERNLFVLAPEIREPVVALLLVNRERGVLQGAAAINAPSIGAQRERILEDIAVMVGGACFNPATGVSLERAALEQLGRARQAWAQRGGFGILGGVGSREAIRRRLVEARAELRVSSDDRFLRQKISERIARLSGTGAFIRVGAPTQSAQEELRLRLEAALAAGRQALDGGVVPGGGAALARAARSVDALEVVGEAALGARILARALHEPARAIMANGGREPAGPLAGLGQRDNGWSYDVLRGDWVDCWEGGLLDPLRVTSAALRAAVSAAATALTAEVLVRRLPPRIVRQRSRR